MAGRKSTAAKAAEKRRITTEEAGGTVIKKRGRKPGVKNRTKNPHTTRISVQFGGKSYSEEDLVKIVKDVWKYDLQKKEEDIKKLELYVKTEDSQVFYVINEDVTGSFGI